MRADSGKTGCLLAAVALTALAALCVGVVSVSEGGSPPGGWPAELTPYLNGVVEYGIVTRISETHYVIPFEDRESFERAWPLLLTLKSPGGSLTLYRAGQPGTSLIAKPDGPSVRILGPIGSTVTIKGVKQLHAGPPWPDSIRDKNGTLPEYVIGTVDGWIPADSADQQHLLDRARVDIVLVVDGEVIDLNRIPLPADTLIIDRRWPKAATQPASRPASQPAGE